MTGAGAAIGTVAYMSPEQAGGGEVDARSDLFSLGVVLYEMSTGVHPFSDSDVTRVLDAIKRETPIPPRELNAKMPAGLSKIIEKAMQKRAAQRYQHAAELREDLKALGSRGEFVSGTRRNVMIGTAIAAAMLLVAVAAALWVPRVREWFAGKSPAAESRIHSLAVLPFKNLTGDPSQEYFVDGITETLIAGLTKLGSPRVISRISAMHYKDVQKPLPEIARELDVNALVEGSVARSGTHVRVTAELVDAGTGQNLWAAEYERDVQNVVQLQSELAMTIAREVAGKLTQQEKAGLQQVRNVKPEVYEAYLKGLYFTHSASEDGVKKGIEYFQEAARADPSYAPAYAGMSEAYAMLGGIGPDTWGPKRLAMKSARKAIALDDSLAEAHTALGRILHRYMQDWGTAEKELRRAIELNANYAMAHAALGALHFNVGREAPACDEFHIAHELDPMNPLITDPWAGCVDKQGQFDQAVRLLQEVLEINPNNPDALWRLGEIYEKHGMFPEAIAEYQIDLSATGGTNFIPYALLGSAYAASGETAKAERIIRKMNAKFGEDKWVSAAIYARMGKRDLALRNLEEDTAACGPGTCGPAYSLMVSNFRFDSLRSEPRFQAILKKFNYPDSAFPH